MADNQLVVIASVRSDEFESLAELFRKYGVEVPAIPRQGPDMPFATNNGMEMFPTLQMEVPAHDVARARSLYLSWMNSSE